MRRAALVSVRDRISLLALPSRPTILAVAIGWIFLRPFRNLSGIRSITSSLYVVLVVVSFAPLTLEVPRLWSTDGRFYFKEDK